MMKAELETKELQNRGVSLTSETPEEAQMLTNLWNQKARPAAWARLPDGNVQLCIAPSPEKENGT